MKFKHTSPAYVLASCLLLALVAQGCLSLPTAKQKGVSYATTPSLWPAEQPCLNKNKGPIVAKEVLMGKTMTVVVSGGPRAIPDEVWPNFSPGGLNRKNSNRHTMFTQSCFLRSPDAPARCQGDECREFVDIGGYSWVPLSKVEAVDCVPSAGGCDPGKVRPGQLAFVVTRKCHELIFEGKVFMLRGPAGEEAVMHATADGNPTTSVALPAGWSLAEQTLEQPLVVHPFGGGDACYYNILRDTLAQSYHQIRYAGAAYP